MLLHFVRFHSSSHRFILPVFRLKLQIFSHPIGPHVYSRDPAEHRHRCTSSFGRHDSVPRGAITNCHGPNFVPFWTTRQSDLTSITDDYLPLYHLGSLRIFRTTDTFPAPHLPPSPKEVSLKCNERLRPSWNYVASKMQRPQSQIRARWNDSLYLTTLSHTLTVVISRTQLFSVSRRLKKTSPSLF